MSEIGGFGLGVPVDVLSNAVHGANLEQTQIANNIANVNTPNFRRSTTSFHAALAESLAQDPDPDTLPLATNDPRQFSLDQTAPVPFDPTSHVDDSIQARVDHSNVDIDQESALLSSNSGYEQTMTQLLQAQYKRLRQAITETVN